MYYKEKVLNSDYHMILIKMLQSRKQHITNPEDRKSFAPLGAVPTDKKSEILSVRLFTYENQGFTDASCFSAIVVSGFSIIFPYLNFISLCFLYCVQSLMFISFPF